MTVIVAQLDYEHGLLALIHCPELGSDLSVLLKELELDADGHAVTPGGRSVRYVEVASIAAPALSRPRAKDSPTYQLVDALVRLGAMGSTYVLDMPIELIDQGVLS